jgi:hypothetical protein
MVFTVNPNIALRRTYRKDLLANVLAAQPGLGPNPYTPPNWNFLGQLGQGYMAGQAGAEAQRLENQQKAAQQAMSRVLFGGTVPAATAPAAPQPTGFLSRAKQAIFPSVPTVSQSMGKYAGATAITPEMSVDAGADPLQMELSKRTIAAQDLTISQQTALRAVRTLQNKKAAAGALTPDEQKTYDAALQNLPADVSGLNTIKPKTNEAGKIIGYETFDVFGNVVDMDFAPAGMSIDMSKKSGTKFAEGIGTNAATQINDLQNKISGNVEIVARLNTMEALLGGDLETGKVQEILLPIRNILADAGLLSDEDRRKMTNQQVFQAAAKYIIPRMRVEGSGSSSDFEQDMFASATAKMSNTPEANRIIIAGMKALDKHARRVLSMKEKFAMKNNHLLGFEDHAEEYFKENPIFQKYKAPTDLANDIDDGKLNVGDLWFDEQDNRFRILSELTVQELERNGLFAP